MTQETALGICIGAELTRDAIQHGCIPVFLVAGRKSNVDGCSEYGIFPTAEVTKHDALMIMRALVAVLEGHQDAVEAN